MRGSKINPPGLMRRADIAVTTKFQRLESEGDVSAALVLARDTAVADWIADELRHSETELGTADTVDEVLLALFDIPPPRPQILVVDFDPLNASEVFQLHAVRARGWFGVIIGLGTVAPALRTSLAVHRVLARPLDDGALARAFEVIGVSDPTSRIPILRRGALR